MKYLNLLFGCLLFTLVIILTLRCTDLKAGAVVHPLADSYSCIPCGQSCDKEVHASPGTCTNCNMPLVKTSTINFKTVESSQICDFIGSNPDIVLFDVRTKAEFEGETNPKYGRLKNAINVPIQELETKLNELSAYKDKKILVYCSLSRRSPRASYILSQNGFNNVTNMAGGISTVKDEACKQ